MEILNLIENEKKALFAEEDRVEIRLEKAAGNAAFRRSIAASDAMAAVKGLAALVSHLAELIGVHPGDILARMAMELITPEGTEGDGTDPRAGVCAGSE